MNILKKTYVSLRVSFIITFLLFICYQFLITENTSTKLSLILTFPLFYWCVIKLIDHWYSYRKIFLLDWFKLSSFLSIILPFILDAPAISRNTNSVAYETLSINNKYVIDAVIVYFIAISTIQLTQFILQKKVNNRTVLISKQNLNLKIYFSFFAILISLFQIYFFLENLVGFGSSTMSNQYLYHIISTFNIANLYVLTLVYYSKSNRNSFAKITFIFVLFVSLLCSFLSGLKEQTFLTLIVVLVPYLKLGYRLKLIHYTFLIILYLFIYQFSNNYREDLFYSNSKIAALTNAFNSTFYLNPNNSFKENDEYSLISRFSHFYSLVHGVSIESEWNEYKHLNRYYYLPIAWLLPRSILPNKPSSDMGGKLYQIIRNNNTSGVSVSPSTFGWAYLEGGFIYVFICFFLYALVIIFIENYFHSKSTLQKDILILVLLLGIIKTESDIYFRLTSIFQSIFIVFIFSILFLNAKKN